MPPGCQSPISVQRAGTITHSWRQANEKGGFIKIEAHLNLAHLDVTAPRLATWSLHNGAVIDVPPEPPQKASLRRLLWWVFWLVALTTPVVAVVIPMALRRTPLNRVFPMEWMMVGSLVAGICTAGFIFAWLTTKTVGAMILRGILCAVAIFSLYLFIGYAGCVVAFSR
jgi:hypothetical protein